MDLEVAEKGVGAEEGEDFVAGVVGGVGGIDRERSIGRLEEWESGGRAACAGAEGEDGDVAEGLLGGVVEEDGAGLD